MQTLYYIQQNADVPQRRVTSTARRGVKWFNLVSVGDRIALTVKETDEKFGEAVVVLKEVAQYVENGDTALHIFDGGDAATS